MLYKIFKMELAGLLAGAHLNSDEFDRKLLALTQIKLDFETSIKNARNKFGQVHNRNCTLGTAKSLLLRSRFFVQFQHKLEEICEAQSPEVRKRAAVGDESLA